MTAEADMRYPQIFNCYSSLFLLKFLGAGCAVGGGSLRVSAVISSFLFVGHH